MATPADSETLRATMDAMAAGNENELEVTPSKGSSQKRGSSRFSALNTALFSQYSSTASPSQAKKALEAHMMETNKRLEEASKLGTALVQQKRELEDRLKDVEQAQSEREINPELRQKLAEIEKEYNELGRETARVFLAPRRDDVSLDENGHPIRAPSPTKFNARATDSPSKMTAPSRKSRNQTGNRVHDIEFATEISQSLLSQVRSLQAALLEKEEALKSTQVNKERLELDMKAYTHKLKSLDENEQRYKDENWSLETQTHDLLTAQREANAREQKLQHNLAVANAEKTAAQREVDEVRSAHSKLAEELNTHRKTHESELASVRKSMNFADSDRTSLERKIEDLTNQNQELANFIASRPKSSEPTLESEHLTEPEDLSLDKSDLEHASPPGSPMKGARNSMLESETLKSSLQHAHRMIQNLKGHIHREKTEKLELKRQLQDTKDELDIRRQDGAPASGKRPKGLRHKPSRPGQLGTSRAPNTEIIDGGDWVDQEGEPKTPKLPKANARLEKKGDISEGYATATDNDGFATANETDGFETANERDSTENEFATGAESPAGGSDDQDTETEDTVQRTGTVRSSRVTPHRPGHMTRDSFASTASTSDEDDTPLRGSRYGSVIYRNKPGGSRWSRLGDSSAASSLKNSPASFAPPGASLGDELGDFMDDDDYVDGESVGDVNTPSRVRSRAGSKKATPNRGPLNALGDSIRLEPTPHVPPVPRLPMVDSAVMTEAWQPETIVKEIPVEVTRDVPREVIKEVPVEIVKTVEVPVEVIKEIVKEVEVPREIIKEVEVPKEIIKEVEVPVEVVKTVEVPVEVIKEVIKEVRVPIEVIKEVPVEVPSKETAKSPEASQTRELVEAGTSMTPAKPTAETSHQRSDTALFIPKTDSRKFSVSPVNSVSVEPSAATLTQKEARPPSSDTIADENGSPTKKNKPFSFAQIYTPSNPPPDGTPHKEPARPPTAVKEEQEKDNTAEKAVGAGIIGGTLGWLGGKVSSAITGSSAEPPQEAPAKETQTKQPLGETSNNTAGRSTVQRPTTPVAQIKTSDMGEEAKGPVSPVRSVRSATGLSAGPESPRPALPTKSVRRPSSTNSMRRSGDVPPLPADHQKVIEAASKRNTAELPRGVVMGPPIAPASAYRNSQIRTVVPSADNTPKANWQNVPRVSRHTPGSKSLRSRRSSISSFESELDDRFHLRNGMLYPGMDSNTDPRMITAITQTMIGEYLWKYTRKAGGSKMSNNRHRRFFWVHPYTRTLYWSDRDPASAGHAQLKAKSVQIEAVRVVQDDNPFPPGLHRKSLIVLTPSGGRDLKFTAPTGMRHETWFNSLSYLLLRQNPETAQQSVNEHQGFNPTASLVGQDGNPGPHAADRASLSTYHSRPGTARMSRASSVHRGDSPMRGGPGNGSIAASTASTPATVRRHPPPRDSLASNATAQQQTPSRASSRGGMAGMDFAGKVSNGNSNNTNNNNRDSTAHMSVGRRISSMLRPGRASIGNSQRVSSQTLQSLQTGEDGSIYNASVVQSESAEDLREQYAQQAEEEEERGVENVRACCDGKHDVGSISRQAGKRASHHHHHHH